MVSSVRWTIISWQIFNTETGYCILVSTDVPVHAWLLGITTQGQLHLTEVSVAGLNLVHSPTYSGGFTRSVEQDEAGDTLIHTFCVTDADTPPWRMVRLLATVAGLDSPSTGFMFNFNQFTHPLWQIDITSSSSQIGNPWNLFGGQKILTQPFKPTVDFTINTIVAGFTPLLFKHEVITVGIYNTNQFGEPGQLMALAHVEVARDFGGPALISAPIILKVNAGRTYALVVSAPDAAWQDIWWPSWGPLPRLQPPGMQSFDNGATWVTNPSWLRNYGLRLGYQHLTAAEL